MQDTLSTSPPPNTPILHIAFRPFFLLGSLFSGVAMLIWFLTVSGQLELSLYRGGLFWHTHEMIVGFTVAISVGFLLTAVQNWTGVKSVNGLNLAILFFLWLVARILFLFDYGIEPIAAAKHPVLR